ncbi:Deoxyribose-phosphate aldolase [compost metagenome]
MLECIAEADGTVGFKASGGLRTLEDALVYLQLAERLLGKDWITPQHLRFGASSLLGDLLRRLADQQVEETLPGQA